MTNAPMSAREALEIVQVKRDSYADRVWLDSCMAWDRDDSKRDDRLDANGIYAAAFARWDRARAIVNALVEAHEARCAVVDSRDPRHADAAIARVGQTFQRVRALERGEQPKESK